MRCKKRKRSHLFFVGLDDMHHCNIITEEVTSAKLLVLIFSAGRCGLREYSWLTTEFTDCLPTIFTAISLSIVVQASARMGQERNLRIMLKQLFLNKIKKAINKLNTILTLFINLILPNNLIILTDQIELDYESFAGGTEKSSFLKLIVRIESEIGQEFRNK